MGEGREEHEIGSIQSVDVSAIGEGREHGLSTHFDRSGTFYCGGGGSVRCHNIITD